MAEDAGGTRLVTDTGVLLDLGVAKRLGFGVDEPDSESDAGSREQPPTCSDGTYGARRERFECDEKRMLRKFCVDFVEFDVAPTRWKPSLNSPVPNARMGRYGGQNAQNLQI